MCSRYLCVSTPVPKVLSHTERYQALVSLLRAPGIAISAQFFQIKKQREKEAGGPSMCCERWSNEAATVHADRLITVTYLPQFLTLGSFSFHQMLNISSKADSFTIPFASQGLQCSW